MSRKPTDDEMELWGSVTRSIAPLTKRPRPAPPHKPEHRPAKAKAPAAKPRSVAMPAPVKPAAKPAPPPSLHPLDRRTRSRLARGTVAIDARIDLHGLTQAAAHRHLIHFLADAQADGARVVLVITGKGRQGESGGEDRGVLRRMVPAWLAAPDLRPLVIGFDEAGRGHGGSGALYVRIRRKG